LLCIRAISICRADAVWRFLPEPEAALVAAFFCVSIITFERAY
jgi:hypothetical protein